MMSTDDTTTRLLQALSDAKTWPARFKRELDSGSKVSDGLREADKKIEALEKRAKEAMKRLGCVNPQTRSIYHGMVDMLINWHAFKDSLK
ncbi:MAG: hypothetical protein JRI58_11445 [Deltaproteobacteria bacterium]|nr:hypothetical protein [Deltaproteobacteria bacterium]MBW2075337.1 hypothetical protein [Deltaproteobacteria bacterium]